MAPERRAPVKSFADPRVEIYAPTDSFPYYRVRGYDRYGNRVVDTSGGRSLGDADAKARQVARRLRRTTHHRSRDPSRVLVRTEVEEWLNPANHRTAGNRPWSPRHAGNMLREWRPRR